MKRIEFGELRIGEMARANLMDCCDRNWASMGEKTKRFEAEWSDLFGYKHSAAMSSGTDAVINACLVLYDLGASPGDQIIVPALGFIATANAVRAAGFTPVPVDIERETLNIDAAKVESAITKNTVAIIAVHTMGRPCDLLQLRDIADKHNLLLIGDSCEAHGAKIGDSFLMEWSDMECFSFYVAHLVCAGEGGMVSTNHDLVADVLQSTRSHGRPTGSLFFDHMRYGLNSKMNDLEASLGLEGVSKFWETFYCRYATMMDLREAVVGYEDKAWFSKQDDGNTNCPHGFSVVVKDGHDIRAVTAALDDANIHWKRNFGAWPTQHGAFCRAMGFNYRAGDFPNGEYVGDHGIHIGCHQYLSEDDVRRMENALRLGLARC